MLKNYTQLVDIRKTKNMFPYITILKESFVEEGTSFSSPTLGDLFTNCLGGFLFFVV
jgi:hypothetical protein